MSDMHVRVGRPRSFPPIAVPTSLPILLEELHRNMDSVDATVEAICLIMVRRAVVSNEVPVPLGELAKLCGLLRMVRESIAELECVCE